MRYPKLLAATALALIPAIAQAGEIVTYSYDARGRLIQVARSGTVNVGVSASYSYDKADNRTNLTVVDPNAVSFSVGDVTVTEGGTLSFTVTKTGTATGSVSVSYASANGTASAGSDYTAASGTLTFLTSETSKTVSIATTDDSSVESSETVLVNLTNSTGGALISDAQGVGTITDNDVPPPSFSIGDYASIEGDTFFFTVTRSGSTAASNSVSYATANGTAGGLDYFSKSGTLTFAASETTKSISVTTKTDSQAESTETFYVNLTNATGGATITDAQGLGEIWDDGNNLMAPPEGEAELEEESSTPSGSEEGSANTSAAPDAGSATEPVPPS